MSDPKSDFRNEMRRLFRTDEKDLDFGIYRIINQKNRIIDKYLDEELPEKIENALKRIIKIKREEIDREIEEMEKEAGKLGMTPDQVPKMKKRYEELLKMRDDIGTITEYEKLVYNHLISFFSRYYQDGDFISRFFFKDTYLIPYDGSETYLHWATRNMYFVKASTKYKRFSFSAPGKSVLLRVVEAEEKKGNKKGNNTYFILSDPEYEEMDDEIAFNFKIVFEDEEIKALGNNKTERQKKLNNQIASKISKIAKVEKEKVVKYLEKFQRNYVEDFFIHKNLRKFLLDQMNFYINTEILDVDSYISEKGANEGLIAVAAAFKEIAKDIIRKLGLIEEFKKKAWEKKKFVLSTEYVVTIDKLDETDVLNKILEKLKDQMKNLTNKEIEEISKQPFKKMKDLDERFKVHEKLREKRNQWLEWVWLEIIDAKNKDDLKEIMDKLMTKSLNGKPKVPKELKFLPIDTYYFDEELKWKILEALSDKAMENNKGLDDMLDGILIQSDNFQALNLLMEKYGEKIQTIYIDPPFNLGTNADFPYKVNYKDSTWITMLENRIWLARQLLNEKGSMFVRCDYNGNMYVRLLMNEIFGDENFRNEIVIKKTSGLPKRETMNMEREVEYIDYYVKNTNEMVFNQLWEDREKRWMPVMIKPNRGGPTGKPIVINGVTFKPKDGYSWAIGNEIAQRMYKEGRLKVENNKLFILIDKKTVGNNWTDIPGYVSPSRWSFSTENHEKILKRVIETSSNPGDWVMDFFLGSGTTTAVAHKLRRKWIGVEMGDHFWTVVLPRMKKVLAYDKSGISKEKDVKENYSEKNAGGFFKYQILEQYEDTLENIKLKEGISEDKVGKWAKSTGDLIEYMFEEGVDKSESKTFLGVDTEKHFKGIKIKILREDGSHEEKELDLIETFNYLAGIHIKKMFSRKFGSKTYYAILGEMRNQKVIVVWREPCKSDKEKREDEKNIKHLMEDKEFKKIERIFVNSDSFVENQSNTYDEMRNLLW